MPTSIVKKLFFYYIAAVLLIPKITLIPVVGYGQGIRIENLFCLIIVAFIYQYFFKVEFRQIKFFVVIILWLIIATTYSQINGQEVNFIVILRLLEYMVIYIAIKETITLKLWYLKLFKILVALNFIAALGQYFQLLGAFPSEGYLNAGHGWLERAYGLAGGPWELGVIVGAAFFNISKISNSPSKFYLYQAILCLILASTRTNILAFTLTYFLYLNSKIKLIFNLRNFTYLILITIILFYNFNEIISILRIDNIFNKLQGIYSGANINNLKEFDLSLYNRFLDWEEVYQLWSANYFYILFGMGLERLYLESLYARILFSFGIFGVIYFYFQIKKTTKYIACFILISGLTLDIFISMKIYTSLMILILISNDIDKINCSKKTS